MIILLGLPKSGTTSFNYLFTQLGYTSYHWTKHNKYIGMIIKNNKKHNKPLLTGFNKNDCITQMDICIDNINAYWPQIHDYKQLYYENKDSIFILNKRDPIKLLSSFKRWNNLDKRLYKYNPEMITNKTNEGFIYFVNRHYQNVTTFFKSKKEAKFIIYDIERENINKLSKYINIKDKKFPKKNVNNRN